MKVGDQNAMLLVMAGQKGECRQLVSIVRGKYEYKVCSRSS